MKKPRTAVADMHVVIDAVGERAAVTVAADLARRLDAHLTGIALAFTPLLPVYSLEAPVPADVIEDAREAVIAEARAAAAEFETVAARVAVPFETRLIDDVAGEGVQELIAACRLSDLTVVGQYNPDKPDASRPATIQALLFDAGVPTLIVPYAGVLALDATRVIVAWDGSAQAGRALRGALPLLAMAKAVTVVIVAEERKSAASLPGADVADHLARHGLKVEVERLDNPMGNVAATILNAVAEDEAGLLVMGAYAHSRIRQLVLGGVTREVLAAETVPVLMAH